MEKSTDVKSSSGPTGPTGPSDTLPVDPLITKIKTLDLHMENLFKTCSAILNVYIENPDLIKAILKEMKLDITVEENDVLVGFDRFAKGYRSLTDIRKKNNNFLVLFNKIMSEKQSILMQTINDDGWIRRDNVRAMFAENVGKTSTIVIYLSQIYRYALAIKDNAESKIKAYPDMYKPDDKTKYPLLLIYHCFQIFKLTTAGEETDKAKSINMVISNLENKLGLAAAKAPAIDIKSMMGSAVNPILAVSADMLNKYQKSQPGGSSAPPISQNQLKGFVEKVFTGDTIGNLVGSIQNAAQNARNSGGQPDLGKIFSEVAQNIRPDELMNTLHNAAKEEMPILASIGEKDKGQPVTSNNSNSNQEKPEIIDEVEEVEEIVEEETIEEIEDA